MRAMGGVWAWVIVFVFGIAIGACGSDSGGGGGGGGGGSAQLPENVATTYTVSRFGRSDSGDLYYLADVEILVRTDPDDGSAPREWKVSTVGKEPDYVPFVTLLSDTKYHVAYHGGHYMRWDGTAFVDLGDGSYKLPDNFGIGEGQLFGSDDERGLLSYALYYAPDRVNVSDAWDPELPAAEGRHFCSVSQLGCSCSRDPADASSRSWDTCPLLDYHCCWESADGNECTCQAPGSVTYLCERRVEMEGGRVVSHCPSALENGTDDVRFVGALTAPTFELPRVRVAAEARASGRVQIRTVPCSAFEFTAVECSDTVDGGMQCSGVCDVPDVVDNVLLRAYLSLLRNDCAAGTGAGASDASLRAYQCTSACAGDAVDTIDSDRAARQIDAFECQAP